MSTIAIVNLAPALFFGAVALGGTVRIARSTSAPVRRTLAVIALGFLSVFGYLAMFPALSGQPTWLHIFGPLRNPWIWPFWLGYFALLVALHVWTWWFGGDKRLVEAGCFGFNTMTHPSWARGFALALLVMFTIVFTACHAFGVYDSMLRDIWKGAQPTVASVVHPQR